MPKDLPSSPQQHDDWQVSGPTGINVGVSPAQNGVQVHRAVVGELVEDIGERVGPQRVNGAALILTTGIDQRDLVEHGERGTGLIGGQVGRNTDIPSSPARRDTARLRRAVS